MILRKDTDRSRIQSGSVREKGHSCLIAYLINSDKLVSVERSEYIPTAKICSDIANFSAKKRYDTAFGDQDPLRMRKKAVRPSRIKPTQLCNQSITDTDKACAGAGQDN